MSYRVLLTDEALRDLEDIDDFTSASDSPDHADKVLTRIDEAISNLKRMPERGSHPKELLGRPQRHAIAARQASIGTLKQGFDGRAFTQRSKTPACQKRAT